MIPVKIWSQPDDTTCGPTCLHAIYHHLGDNISLDQVIKEVTTLEDGGTLAVMLGSHALRRGYKVHIYTYNIKIFDPTWFTGESTNLLTKLKNQTKFKHGKKFLMATQAYVNFLQMGGEVHFEELTSHLLRRYLDAKRPILTGLSSTYLYKCAREYTTANGSSRNHDEKGYPAGHFVILSGYDKASHQVLISDPFKENPVAGQNYYPVHMDRLIASILLGIMTYDANLMIIEPKKV